MAKIYLRKTLAGLVPDDEDSVEVIKKLSIGDVVSCDIKKPRNYRFHKKFFSMFNLAFENQDHFAETKLGKDQFYDWLKLKARHADYCKTPDGNILATPKSISFASMDETTFQEFYEDIKDVIFELIIPDADPARIHDFEQAMLGY